MSDISVIIREQADRIEALEAALSKLILALDLDGPGNSYRPHALGEAEYEARALLSVNGASSDEDKQ